MKFFWVTLLLLLGLQHPPAQASLRDPVGYGFKRPYLFIGGDAGWSLLSASLTEGDKDGLVTNLKLVGSVYFKNVVLDLGGGALYNRLDGRTPLLGNAETSIRTRAGFIELSARYRFGGFRRVQLGPTLNWAIREDLGFTPNVSAQNQQQALFGGAQIFYDFPLQAPDPDDFWRIRVGARYLMDLNVSQKQVHFIQASIEIGLPLLDPPTSVQPQSPSNETSKKPELKVNIGLGVVQFVTGRSELTEEYKSLLNQLGHQLSLVSNDFDHIEVEGHTDIRGSYEYNLLLSQERAASVSQALTEGGLNAAKIGARGYGPSQPIDPENTKQAWSKNRRVELGFYGVKNAEKIKTKIQNFEEEFNKAKSSVPLK